MSFDSILKFIYSLINRGAKFVIKNNNLKLIMPQEIPLAEDQLLYLTEN